VEGAVPAADGAASADVDPGAGAVDPGAATTDSSAGAAADSDSDSDAEAAADSDEDVGAGEWVRPSHHRPAWASEEAEWPSRLRTTGESSQCWRAAVEDDDGSSVTEETPASETTGPASTTPATTALAVAPSVRRPPRCRRARRESRTGRVTALRSRVETGGPAGRR
jgi:hypothetical protein